MTVTEARNHVKHTFDALVKQAGADAAYSFIYQNEFIQSFFTHSDEPFNAMVSDLKQSDAEAVLYLLNYKIAELGGQTDFLTTSNKNKNKLLSLTEWAKERYENPPHINTLRHWAREGLIYPAPIIHGRSYRVKRSAKHYEQGTGLSA